MAPARGNWGRRCQGSQRSPHLPGFSPNHFCSPLSFLFWLQSTYRCGAVGHNQGAQVRNGAWQPLACTRLPECNFPIITLPNFSASVKDHLLTQRSRARAGQEARPFVRNHFQQAEKTHSLPPFRHERGPQETSPGPPGGSDQPAARRLPSRHPLARAGPLFPRPPRFSVAPRQPSRCPRHRHPLIGSPSRTPTGRLCQSFPVTSAGSPTPSPPPASGPLSLRLLKPSPTCVLCCHLSPTATCSHTVTYSGIPTQTPQ